ncbi:hypothetical protein LEP1GSC074_1399 [Leptospira noguchii str. Hook]|nr:hypothetical protein LEP1GSC074_1399 [Leptospira noguchii str. Hook]
MAANFFRIAFSSLSLDFPFEVSLTLHFLLIVCLLVDFVVPTSSSFPFSIVVTQNN